MKITKVDVLRAKPNERGWTPVLCRIYTDEGIYGDGEAALGYGGVSRSAFGMVQDCAARILGMNPLEHEVIWNHLYRNCFWGRNGGPLVFGGISAIDIALWDIKGKAYGVPVHELLGGKQRESLRAYASQIQFGWGPDYTPARSLEDYAREAKKAIDDGYDCVKADFFSYKEGEGRFTENEQAGLLSQAHMKLVEERIVVTREAIGPDNDIILENHCYTDAQSAVQMANMAKAYRMFYFEEPTTPHPELLSYVHRETGLPVASGERIFSRWQYEKFFKEQAIQIAQPDIGTSGGITEVKKICDMAFTHDVGIQIHICGSPIVTAASLQLECTLPNFVIHEQNVWSLAPSCRELAIHDYQPHGGKFLIPDLPGIGNEISEEAFAGGEVGTLK